MEHSIGKCSGTGKITGGKNSQNLTREHIIGRVLHYTELGSLPQAPVVAHKAQDILSSNMPINLLELRVCSLISMVPKQHGGKAGSAMEQERAGNYSMHFLQLTPSSGLLRTHHILHTHKESKWGQCPYSSQGRILRKDST